MSRGRSFCIEKMIRKTPSDHLLITKAFINIIIHNLSLEVAGTTTVSRTYFRSLKKKIVDRMRLREDMSDVVEDLLAFVGLQVGCSRAAMKFKIKPESGSTSNNLNVSLLTSMSRRRLHCLIQSASIICWKTRR